MTTLEQSASFTAYQKRVIYELTSIKGSIWGLILILLVHWFWR